MPYGSGHLIRQALVVAKPWQRYVLAIVMVAAGVGLVFVGHVAGALLGGAGLLLLVRMVRVRVGGRHRADGRSRASGPTTWDHPEHDRADQP
jgi:hypothetical protein